MATVVLQYAGAALGTLLGGPLGGTLGRALGGLAGAVIDHELFGNNANKQGPRLGSLSVMASQEGSPIPTVFGRMKIAGQVIWATNLSEVSSTTSSSGGKGSGGSSGPTVTQYTYFANFAVGLCEGPILGVGRCWADGKEIDLAKFAPRIYLGSEIQQPDSLISSIEGAQLAPAFRGLAYLVFEQMPLANFGNRLPQLAIEVFAKGNEAAKLVQAVNIIPSATEFGYETALVTQSTGAGSTVSENTHASATLSDWSVSMNQLQEACPNVGMASLTVAWFGTDLRCGQCQFLPGTENPGKNVAGASWTVSGMSRNQVHVVSQVNNAPAFGGTPSDQSVLNAIADLKSRGLKVMFYPFVLMDIPTGNTLPDPYGNTAQGSYPWRGRITASISPGMAGTPDKTSAMSNEIAAFAGSATASQFSAGNGTVSFSGSEWSYRRMILHYAKLCAVAGGVDAFLIGSELRGLTTLRSAAGTYPFVAAIQALAADVKAILPNAKVSYAADWSEYFGHQPQDGTGDVYFHLDALWASPAVDFIGIDNYFPLTDWRDGTTHLDYVAGTNSIYDSTYLSSRIASGEAFDWYYASANDRDHQTRTAITDGRAGRPWVFRAKDIRSWWLNTHYNRPGGVEQSQATPWVPQSKPVWFTEIGCPAVDKGANQPNVFIDAKSSESALPHYSNARQDAQLQLAFLSAAQNYWSASTAQNPVSQVYGASMVDATRMFWWCWDARPYPSFPARGDVWSDAANYATGHWLNGRIGSVTLAALIAALAARFGFSAIDVGAVEGTVDGFMLDRPMSARDALDSLLNTFAIDAVESAGVLKFISRTLARPVVLDAGHLIDDAKANPLLSQHRAQETDLPVTLHLAYVESGLDYRQATVTQQRSGTSSKNEASFSLAAGLTQDAAQARADVVLAESWAARETANFSLPPSFAAFEPGDVLQIGSDFWRLKSVKADTARGVEALGHDAAVYDPPPSSPRGIKATLPAVYGLPEVLVMDLAFSDSVGSPAPRIAAQATPWPGSLAVFKRTSAFSFAYNSQVQQQATMGTSQSPLNSGMTDRFDFSQTLDVTLRSGTLASASEDEVLAGANLLAIGTADTGYEILQFLNAVLVASSTYHLSGFLRAQGGSGPEMLATRASGQNVVLLNAAVVQPQMTTSEAGQGAEFRIGPRQLDYGNAAYDDVLVASSLRALRPFSPTYFKMQVNPSGLLLTWIRRSRQDGDSWELADVPLGEATETYQLQILKAGNVVRTVTTSQPSYVYALADAISDFGAVPASLDARVSQTSAVFGPGAILEQILHV